MQRFVFGSPVENRFQLVTTGLIKIRAAPQTSGLPNSGESQVLEIQDLAAQVLDSQDLEPKSPGPKKCFGRLIQTLSKAKQQPNTSGSGWNQTTRV